MGKQPIKKQSVSDISGMDKLSAINKWKTKNNLQEIKEKPQEWLCFVGDGGEAMQEAIDSVGVPLNYITTVMGHSNTGKTTECIEAIKACQKQGLVVVYFDIEGAASWSHMKDSGVNVNEYVDEETGEVTYGPADDIIYYNTVNLYEQYKCYDHQENKYKQKPVRDTYCLSDVALCIEELLKTQKDENWDFNLYFIIDSIGTGVTYRAAIGNKSTNYDYAGEFANAFDLIGQELIPSGKYVTSKWSNGMMIVNKLSVERNMQGLPIAKAKGSSYAGDYMRRYTVFFGNQGSSGARKQTLDYKGETYEYGRIVKVSIIKNHVTNITREGEILVTSTGFVPSSKKEQFKAEYKKWLAQELSKKYAITVDENDFIEKEVEVNE